MKRKNLLILTSLLLTQTAPVWAMDPPDDQDHRRAEHQRNVRNRRIENGWAAVENGQYGIGAFNYEEAFQNDDEPIHEPLETLGPNPQVRRENIVPVMNDADTKEIRTRANGQQILNVRRTGFIPFLTPEVNELVPSTNPIFENLGMAKQSVVCTFANDKQVELTLPTEYPLRGKWCFQEDRDHTQNLATLKLSARINNKWKLVDDRRQVPINHILIDDSAPEVSGWNYFNGYQVYQARTKLQRWLNPRTGQEYDRVLPIQDGQVPGHEGHEVIYAEPFAFGGELSKPRDEYRGGYHRVRGLADDEGLSNKNVENFIYSDGNHMYLPKITQELWEKDNTRVGFFIASYKRDRRLNFIPQLAAIQKGQLPEGLYQLLSVQDGGERRTEKWQRLGEYPSVVEIMTPAGLSSIPGFGGHAPHIVSDDETILKTLKLQHAIQEIVAKTEEARALYPNVAEFVVVLGKTGSGKSALINGLAGGLNAQEDEDGNLRLHADQLLPGFNIGHHAVVGTKIPGVWYDEVNNKLYWDCPGFGDVRGPDEDIINAFAIDKIFQNSAVKVLLVAQDYDLNILNTRGQGFYKLLDELTKFFPNEGQLKAVLSLVVSQGGRPMPHLRLNTLQRKMLEAGEGLNISGKSRRLLDFLNTHNNRVFSFPQPQQEGPYHFDKGRIVNCITDIRQPFITPVVNFKAGVSPEAKLLAGTYGQGLNKYLANYIETEGSQRIINYCNQLIDEKGAAVTLRGLFTQLATNLQNLSTSSPKDFYKNLKTLLNKRVDLKDVKQTIKTIDFLKTINENVDYHVAEWKEALQSTISKLHSLIAPPTGEFKNGVLSINCIYTGAGEIVNILNQHPQTTQLNVCALNTLFLGQNEHVKFDKRGLSISFIAPQWKIGSPVTINLSGANGLPGANGVNPGEHGQPGGAGGNGGHFLGLADTIIQPHYLTINTSAGIGGPGGNGVRGANGFPGAKAVLTDELILTNNIQPTEQLLDQKKRTNPLTDEIVSPYGQKDTLHKAHEDISFTRNFYKVSGTLATAGQDGGQGGKGGFGGKPGEISMNIPLAPEKAISKDGDEGLDGDPGPGGLAGGDHGEDGEWSKDVNRTYKYDSHERKKGKLKASGSAADGLLMLVKHTPSTIEQVPSGNPGQGFNTVGQQQPDPQVPTNHGPLVQAYNLYYQQQATNPNVAPFIKVFPNLQ